MEEVRFKNTSKIDTKEVSLFQSYAMKKTIWIMSIAFMLIFVGAGVGLFFVNSTVGIILIVCGLAGGGFFLPYLLKENQKRQNEQLLGDNKYLNTYEFYEEYLLATSSEKETAGNSYQEVATEKLNYIDVYKVVTYQDRLFIFLNKSQSLILNFNGMTVGNIEKLIEFLKEKDIQVEDKSKVGTPLKKK